MMYLDDETRQWAEKGIIDDSDLIVHKDSNGAILKAGDTVVLIKDLKVKGTTVETRLNTMENNTVSDLRKFKTWVWLN